MNEAGNIFKHLPIDPKHEIFDTLLEKKNIKIERIVSHGHTSPKSGWYNQEQDEWVMVMQGAATLTFEGGKNIKLAAGDHLNIPAHTKHKVSWTKPNTETVWLVVFYGAKTS